MELNWLEDFVSVARTGSFSRSAKERNVTQSAFSRRIQALESWLGVPLIDRSTYPTALTAAGREFRESAEEMVRMLHGSRETLRADIRTNRQTVAIAALHSLSLQFFPRWFRQIEERTGSLSSRLLPDDFHNCIRALVEGGYDFLLTFHHPDVPILLDPDNYPSLMIGTDSLVAVRSAQAQNSGADLPLLKYAQNSFLGRISTLSQIREGDGALPVTHTNENAMAESLKQMVLEGHGTAWIPRSLVKRELAEKQLIAIGQDTPLDIRLYRSAAHRRPSVSALWKAATEIAAADAHLIRPSPDLSL